MPTYSDTAQGKVKGLPTMGSFVPLEKKIIETLKLKPKKVILLAGPTACGKTALSLQIAEALGGEIISADSMQVYKGMDIGTAKISIAERERIPHYLIDIRQIYENFNVVDFYYEAKQCCESILARNRVPIIVGGTGFYFRALLYGPPAGPPSIPSVRHQLEEDLRKFGSEAMYEKLKNFDPEYATTITHGDKHKIIRALEIITLTGNGVSKLSWNREAPLNDYRFCAWFLNRPREILYERIEARCEQMLQEGLIEEVKKLTQAGLQKNPSAAQAIGYRQVLDYLQTPQSPDDYDTLTRAFKTASRHYAKRQLTWFRKEPLFRWLDLHDPSLTPLDTIIHDYLSI